MDRPQDYESCYWSSNLHASTIFYGSVAQLVSSNRLLSDGSWVQVPPLLPFFLIGSIAQLAEHITFNDRVAGSFPATPTNLFAEWRNVAQRPLKSLVVGSSPTSATIKIFFQKRAGALPPSSFRSGLVFLLLFLVSLLLGASLQVCHDMVAEISDFAIIITSQVATIETLYY